MFAYRLPQYVYFFFVFPPTPSLPLFVGQGHSPLPRILEELRPSNSPSVRLTVIRLLEALPLAAYHKR